MPTEPAHTPHPRSVGHGAPLHVAETLNAPLKTRDRPHFGRAAARFVLPVDPCANSCPRCGLRRCVARLPTSPISASANAASAPPAPLRAVDHSQCTVRDVATSAPPARPFDGRSPCSKRR